MQENQTDKPKRNYVSRLNGDKYIKCIKEVKAAFQPVFCKNDSNKVCISRSVVCTSSGQRIC